jgi:alkylhydroperoxidase/carboxymuconolactone decarboxylase family protein YurZ
MTSRGPSWQEYLRNTVPDLLEHITSLQEATTKDGALSLKTKTLMMMLCDALLGHTDGVAAIANRARALGANENEIAETVAVAFLMGGLPGLVTASNAFRK